MAKMVVCNNSIACSTYFKTVKVHGAAMQQKLSFPNKHGEKLVGILHDTGSSHLVILCHGFRSSKNDKILVSIADALEKEGISAFRLDFSGNGESEGSFQFGNYSRELEDIRSVFEYFIGSNRSPVAVVGHSKGGDAVILYASKYHDIPAVVNLSSPSDLLRGMEDRFGKDIWNRLTKDGYVDVISKAGEWEYRLTEEGMRERLNTDMREACRSIDVNCRVLTVHGTKDEVIPVGDAYEFAKMIRNHQLKIIQGANHGYTSHQEEMVSAVLPFLKECMSRASTQVSSCGGQ
ncbi:uncharacterized protein LOC121751590 isoform X3 [Salvia splendens]|uniref:uncharacterized protein LOC121751590 isoform X3 n=1 Tax=Salvia splendens TaxID=180675 RepID=UPI001C2747FC|nr:uncharacterized protein LOC121751590 isoform X3 [Salvia splendens]